MGNICRSPMAERLLVRAAQELVSDPTGELLRSVSAGTGGWHVGEPMNPPAAREVHRRGGSDTGFIARRLRGEHLDTADLILTATGEQAYQVLGLRPHAASRTFVLGEFGRLLPNVDLASLPASVSLVDHTPVAADDPTTHWSRGDLAGAVYARGVALVKAVDAIRNWRPPLARDDLEDPWGSPDATFARVADAVDRTIRPLAAVLLG
jgi:protein-tyrosine phosphatase